MRTPLFLIAALGLAACAPTVPAGNLEGVGFQDYQSYLRQREAALNGTAPAAPVPLGAPMAPAGGTGFSPERIGAAIDTAVGAPPVPHDVPGATGAVIGAPAYGQPLSATVPPLAPAYDPNDPNRPRGEAFAGIEARSGEVDPNNTGISDEQDFSAVTARETIESDAQRIARNRAQFQMVQPTALPERRGRPGPNIVEFALSTAHPPGTPMYRRSGLALTNPDAACARFASPDLAQEAFLAAGGPERDRRGVDPDGDGYACSWDPRPFRAGLN